MKIKEIIDLLENKFPLNQQESYDNSGLIIGDSNWQTQSAILTVDITEEIIDEAIRKNARLIISHHPLIFGGIKKINGKSWLEKCIIKAIKNEIAIYAIHTNMDNFIQGTNSYLANHFQLTNQKTLRAIKGNLLKMVVYCPTDYAEKLRQAIFEAGAGQIGKYDSCSFNVSGIGTFKAGEQAKPFAGIIGKMQYEDEIRIETIIPKYLKNRVLEAVFAVHPYEEVAYDLYPLENEFSQTGAGIIGELEQPIDIINFMEKLKQITNVKVIKHSKIVESTIKTVAICGGSGAFLIPDAKAHKADIYITGDLKYHDYFEADNQLVLVDIGHYESEQFTKEILCEILKENFPTFAFLKSDINTNPINYL